jgi:hypothetical protein
MSRFRSERRRVARPASVKAADCPCVADLIDFAEGRMSTSDRQRIETHLQATSCGHCQAWIATAGNPPPAAAFPAAAAAADPPSADVAQWQRQAFLDLEQRLRQLEDEPGE